MCFCLDIIVSFNVLGGPSNRRILETRESDQANFLEVSVAGETFAPLPFIVRYLSFEEFQEATDRDVSRIFPNEITESPASCKYIQLYKY